MKKILIILSIFIYSCVTAPPVVTLTSEQITAADYGMYPSNYKEIAGHFISNRLIDPDSARYSNWIEPAKAWGIDSSRGINIFGYRVCVDVNAKNRMGGYTGRKPYYILIREGVVYKYIGGSSYSASYSYSVNSAYNALVESKIRELCRNL